MRLDGGAGNAITQMFSNVKYRKEKREVLKAGYEIRTERVTCDDEWVEVKKVRR